MLRTTDIGSPAGAVRPSPAAGAGRRAPVDAIVAFQRRIGAPEAAARAAMRLADPGATVIVTGQQPGLLGGPIYCVAKALSAVAQARRLARETRTPVVPVFWVASEDHDLDEVNRAVLLDREDEPRVLRLPVVADGRMLSAVDPTPGAPALLEDAARVLAEAQHADAALAAVRAALAPSLSEWFARLFSAWLGEEGLVVVDPSLFRGAAAPVVDLVRRRPGAVRAACGPGPLAIPDLPLFLVDGTGRRRRPAAAAEIPGDPAGVSFDVATRVLAQDLALPVSGHVVGPSEEAYCRQLAPAHALLGIPAPPLLPRASLTLVEGRVERALEAFGTDVPAVLAQGEDALRAPGSVPEDFERALTKVEAALAETLPAVREAAGRADEVLVRKAAGAEQRLMEAIDRLRDHARRALDRAEGRDHDRRRRALRHLRPLGAPQERTLGPLTFLARHGPGLVRDLAKVVEGRPDGRLAVFLSGRRV